jgi:general secretion pathway protein G
VTPIPLRSRPIVQTAPDGQQGSAFSLLEMMTVLALLLIFASFALPTYQNIVLRTREAALRDDLYTLRSLIDRFTLDNRRAPASLEELVEAGYLGAIPSDPFTCSTDTWQAGSHGQGFSDRGLLRW